jgi:hypothetical protein
VFLLTLCVRFVFCLSALTHFYTHTQEQVKGSQGAGKVDEALDRAAKGPDKADEGKAGSKPQLPNRPAGKGKGGRR